ncbi:hypothetical protein LL061_08695 [Escherichia coli]|uniref:hypothetical protein n=1 Tax=Escherichia coli TaxID=562 RepID=UPI001D18E536|nr:hypothetical protein [Escherichia coli]MCC4040366.1 hypothetical protein [Escherichia coli]
MAISQNFKTQVVFGGRIDPSFRRGTTELNDAIRQTSSTVGKLTKSQDKLKDKIAAMKLAGKDVSDLSAQYQKLDRRIKATTQNQEALNTQLAKKQRLEKWTGRAKGAAKWGGRAAARTIKATGKGIKWGTLGAAGLIGGAAAGALAMNAETSEKLGLAKSYGVGVEKYAAWDNIGKAAGLNGENIGDLSEELTNKIGEIGNEKNLNPMLFQIGLTKKRMAGWDREKQFNEVMRRISEMKDEKQAASLADQLMGGEANKIMTYMRATGKSWEQTMSDAQKSNLLTKEGAEGAARAHVSVTNLWGAITSGLADTLGKIGGELAPTFDSVRETFTSWFKDNQGGVVDSIKEWVKPESMKKMWEGIVSFGEACVKFGKIIWAVAKKLEWLIPDEKTDEEQRVYNEEYNKAYQEFMDGGGKYSPNPGMAADNVAKAKADEAVDNMRHPERLARAKSQAESMLAFTNPLAGLINKNATSESQSSATLNIDALRQAVASPAPEQNNKIEINIVGATDPQSIQQSAASGVLDGLRQAANSYNRGSMFDKPAAAG